MDYSGCWIGMAIVGSGMVAALTAVAIAQRLFPADVLRTGHEATGNVLAIVGTLYAVLLGLIVVDAMTHFEKAMDIVQSEANSLADTYLLAERLPEPQRARVQGLCRDYAEQVVKFEWPAMERARMSVAAQRTALALARSLHDFEPRTEVDKTVYPNILEEIEDLWDRRRERAGMAEYGIPVIEWVSLILGGVVTMFFTGLFTAGNTRLQIVITTLAAVVISLNLYIACLLAYPFAGELSVSTRPFAIDLAVFSGAYHDLPACEGEEQATPSMTP